MEKKIFVFIGTTGVGKTYFSKLLEEKYDIKRIKALTTRSERPTHPNEYIHITKEEFQKHIDDGNMLEYTIFDGNYYGKRKNDIFDASYDNHTTLEMTADRVAHFKSQVTHAVVIHLSLEEPIIDNMIARVKERNWTEEQIAKRIEALKVDLVEIDKVIQDGHVDHSIIATEGDREATLENLVDILKLYN